MKKRGLFMWLIFASARDAAVGAENAATQQFPDIVSAQVRAQSADHFDFDVTVSSPYDTPQRYADAFRVMSPGGEVLGERILAHDHADEQPFTRDLYQVKIAPAIHQVVIQGRDKTYGYGGKTIEVLLPGR